MIGIIIIVNTFEISIITLSVVVDIVIVAAVVTIVTARLISLSELLF